MENPPPPDSADPTGMQEILMVEDNATDAQLALLAFKRAAFANPVTVVVNAEEGLDYLFGTGRFAARGPTRPHLILLDLGLPKMSGLDFFHRIRADGRSRAIPVVVLSLSGNNRDVTACVQLGAEAYLIKPVNFENFSRITAGLKLRLTLVSHSTGGKPGGWVLSGAGTVLEEKAPVDRPAPATPSDLP